MQCTILHKHEQRVALSFVEVEVGKGHKKKKRKKKKHTVVSDTRNCP